MAQPFVGEIRLMSSGVVPAGWAACNGQLLQISQNQALFSLIGTTYGGDGRTQFALPDLRQAVPMHTGAFPVGNRFGQASHALTVDEIPTHGHGVRAYSGAADQSAAAVEPSPTRSLASAYAPQQGGGSQPVNLYGTGAPTGTMAGTAMATAGSGLPHENRQPFLTLNFCIALAGLFPPRP